MLESDGTSTISRESGGVNTTNDDADGKLRTCALRLAGIYGPGEQRHIPRSVVNSNSNINNIFIRRENQ